MRPPPTQDLRERLSQNQSEDQLIENLRQTNRLLRFWLEGLAPDKAPPVPQIVSQLLSELLRVGQWLQAGLPEERGPCLQAEVREYRRNLSQLRDHMPAIHSHLLRERARLEAERTRIESSAQWAHASRQTL